MHVILVPGFWLGAESWSGVVPALERAGHAVEPLTLPGVDSRGADRSGIGLDDHIAAVVGRIDAVHAKRPDDRIVLVGHSGGGAIAQGATDRRPLVVDRVVYVDAGPLPSDSCINDQLPAEGDDVPLPEWSFFDETELEGLTDDLRADIEAQAVPEPVRVTRDPLILSNRVRRSVPITIVCTSMPAAKLRELLDEEHPFVSELARIRDVTLVDLPTGHWPQFSRPAELGAVLADALS